MGRSSNFQVVIIWLLLLGIQVSGRMTAAVLSTQLTGKSKHVELIVKRKLAHHRNSDIANTSKRRVPNGPDPFHNRRAGSTRRPPSRS